jgi:hypothetical protein
MTACKNLTGDQDMAAFKFFTRTSSQCSEGEEEMAGSKWDLRFARAREEAEDWKPC